MTSLPEADLPFLVGAAGLFASTVGLIFGIVQTFRYRQAQRNYRELKRIRNTQIWGNIALALQAFDRLEAVQTAMDSAPNVDEPVRRRIAQARESVVAQWLRLIEQAVQGEDQFTEATVEEWCRTQRLRTEWQKNNALRFVQNNLMVKKVKVSSND